MKSAAPRRLAGAVIAALATYTGTALAQPGQVTSASGQQVAQASVTGAQEREAPSARRNVPATTSGVPRDAFEPGYVEQPNGTNWRTAYGECWRGGYWTPRMAAEPCDAVAVATTPAPVATVQLAPEPAPAPRAEPAPAPIVAVPEPRGPMIQKITLETDVLFGFDKAELRPEGQRKLDEIADGLKGAEVNEIVAIGYTDPIGSEQYNQKLSQQRADAVKQYLSQRGVSTERIQTEGRGEQNLVTGGDCRKYKGNKLIECFEPNRRVEIEVFGEREVAATDQPAAGATSSGSPEASAGSGR
ncbi:MAG TPA: OmpA family protein [Burkholderiales bacterium]|nr:OmpA family protein [Burkholderiales bacterium]